MSYSQNEEEKYVLEAVGDLVGVFLDVGAYNGKDKSNTLALVERGWSGVLVEPGIKAFADLLKLHGANKNLNLVHAAVGTPDGIVPFWDSDDSVGTTDYRHVIKWQKVTKFNGIFYTQQVSLPELLARFPILDQVDVVTIDTEGTSFENFLHYPFSGHRPKVFCIEYDDHRQKILDFIAHLKYHVVYESAE